MFLQTVVPNEIQNPAVYDPIVQWVSQLTGQDFSTISFGAIVFRLVLAACVGAVLGAERATKSHAAGLRTYTLVSVASTVCILVNLMLFQKADTARIPASVLTGIGFIGAGTIVTTSRHKVRGLTTAAALWASACIGLAIGAGIYTVGLIATILTVLAVMFMQKFESKLQKNVRMFDIHVELMSRPDLKKLLDYLRSVNVDIKSIDYDQAYANSGLSVYTLAIFSKGSRKEFIRELDLIDMVNQLEYVNYCESVSYVNN
jgi:putative Mg2+ transporter-C (MgtC) family protein